MRLLLSSANLKSVSTTLSAVAMSFMVSACGPNLGGFLPLTTDPAVKKADQTTVHPPQVSSDDPKPTATPSLLDFDIPSGPRSSSVPLPQEPTETAPNITPPEDAPDSPATPDAPSAPATPPAPAAPATPASPAAPNPPVTSPSPAPAPKPSAPVVTATPKPVAPSASPSPSATPAVVVDTSPTPTPRVGRPPLQQVIPIPVPQQEAAIANATVSCEKSDAAHCPTNVAMLIRKDSKNVLEQCTAFLIGDSIMMTNSHCIPDEIKTVGVDCSAQIEVFFPASGAFAPEQINCKNILSVSVIGQSKLKPDFAVFSLVHASTRPPLTLNRKGLPDNLPLRVFAVEPQQQVGIKGLLRTKDCVTAQNTIAVPNYWQNEAPVGLLDDCNIIPGNSGSPALDSDGQVRALVHATIPVLPANAEAAVGLIPATQPFHAVGLMTDIACTDIPALAAGNAGSPAANCALPAQSANDIEKKLLSAFDPKSFGPLIRTWAATTPKAMKFGIDWKAATTSEQHTVMPQMICVQPPSTWLDAGASPDVTLSYTIPIWVPKPQLDPSFRLHLVLSEVDEDSVSIRFDADRLSKTGSAVGSMISTSRSTRQSSAAATFVVVECK